MDIKSEEQPVVFNPEIQNIKLEDQSVVFNTEIQTLSSTRFQQGDVFITDVCLLFLHV